MVSAGLSYDLAQKNYIILTLLDTKNLPLTASSGYYVQKKTGLPKPGHFFVFLKIFS